MRNAVIYARYSSDKQDEASIEAQVRACREYAAVKGYTVLEVYADDGYTGTNFNRPGFKQMLEDIEAGYVTTVIVKDMSRLGRNYLQVGYYTDV